MFETGSEVGSYTLIEQIGTGGFGEVWLAEKRSELITKKVAVKLPHQDQIDLDAIRQEATLWEKASGHPNVLPIIDADIYDGQVVIVSEYSSGGALSETLRHGQLSVKKAVEMAVGILNGLDFLHSRQIIHRDIKPQNILLQNGIPRLADFGISRAMNANTISSVVVGTDAYMAPEAFDGVRNVQTDIWSVGVVLYEMLSGGLPFPQKHPTERMFAILTKDFEQLPEETPIDLKDIVSKTLSKQPEKRFLNSLDMQVTLKTTLRRIRDDLNPPTRQWQGETLAETETQIRPKRKYGLKEIVIEDEKDSATLIRRQIEYPSEFARADTRQLPEKTKLGFTKTWFVFEDEGAGIVLELSLITGLERCYCNGILKYKRRNFGMSAMREFDHENRQYRLSYVSGGFFPTCSLYRHGELIGQSSVKISWTSYISAPVFAITASLLAGYFEFSNALILVAVILPIMLLILFAGTRIEES